MAEVRANYKIQLPSGEVIVFEGPGGLTDEQITHLADNYLANAKPGETFEPSVYEQDSQLPELVGGSVHQPEESSAAGSFFRGVGRGGTLNFLDEISALGNAAIPGMAALDNYMGMSQGDQQAFYDNPEGFWAAVRNNMRGLNQQEQADKALHPTAEFAGEIGGNVATVPIGAGVAGRVLPTAVKEAMAARPVLSGIGIGGVTGGVAGAGAGHEGTRAQSAALGTLAGSVLGGSLATAGEFVPAIQNYANVFFGRHTDQEALRQIVKALKRDGFDVTNPAGVQTLKQTLQEFTGKPVSLADLGSATRSRAGVGLRTPSDVQQQSIDQITNRMRGQASRLAEDVRGTVAPRTDVHALNEDLVAQREAATIPNREAALFEDVPDSTRFEERVFNPTPLSIKQQEAARTFEIENDVNAEATGKTIADQLEEMRMIDGFDNHPVSINEVQGLVLDEMGIPRDAPGALEFAKDVFNRANSKMKFPPREVPVPGGRKSRMVDPVDPRWANDPEKYQLAVEIQNLARLPDAQRALTGALERARSEVDLLAAQGKDISHLPDLSRGDTLDMRTLDYLKRYLDDEVNALYRSGEGRTFKAGEATQVRDLRNALRDRLKAFNPEYEAYLEQYGTSSEMIKALEEGGQYKPLSPEQIGAAQSRRGDAAQEFYRVGAARSMVDDLFKTDRGMAANRILPAMDTNTKQLAAMGVSPANVSKLKKAVEQERVLNLLPQELTGAATDARIAARADASADAGLDLPFNPASKISWAALPFRALRDKAVLSRNQQINEAIMPRLLETDPKIIGGIIQDLEAQGQTQLANQLKRREFQRHLSYVTGNVIGSPVSIQGE